MAEHIQGLDEVQEGPWSDLGQALRAGLPVPDGFIVQSEAAERDVRSMYEDLKVRKHTHFMAVRGPVNTVLDVIGPDTLIQTLRALRAESPRCEVLIQCMVNGSWCGHASWEGTNLTIRASEGLRCLDPDIYLLDTVTNECERQTLHPRPRKVFRAVDGRTRTMEITGERHPLEPQSLQAIAEVAKNVGTEITWVLDDRRVWIVSVGTR